MDKDIKTRKQVSLEQMSGLLEFMQENPELAKGLTRGRRGKLHSVKLWNQCAKKLNPYRDGASKDGKGWSKYWCDWKYRVRRKALELKAAKDNNRPPPDGTVPLSEMEQCLVGLIGENAVHGVLIKTDPLAEGDTEEEDTGMNDINDDVSTEVPNYDDCSEKASTSKWRRKRRHSDGAPPGGARAPRRPRPAAPPPDAEDEAREFLRLQRQQLSASRQLTAAVRGVAAQAARLADLLADVRDALRAAACR